MKAASNNAERQKLAEKVDALANEVHEQSPALATILWGVCGAVLLKRERMFSRMMKAWIESRINEVHKKKRKRREKNK